MARLLKLTSGLFLTVAAAQGPGILRDLHRNDGTARRLVYYLEDGSNPESKDGEIMGQLDSIGASNIVGVAAIPNALANDPEVLEISIEKAGDAYRVFDPETPAVDTPAKTAQLAYNDPSRVNFRSMQEFIRALMNNENLRAGFASRFGSSGDIAAVCVDEVQLKTFLIGTDFNGGQIMTQMAVVEFDSESGSQYGE